ncbi:hypothetical protein V1J52_10380 [Streptomyces sp. TRM 70351]|uniref:hypothetical protein n=1 Tax=Streptomyces sp. TRM 70351 TaxID=3116552 RepID=UPI002E7AFF21|nr:hypothetical protein [Streptomyces sp. TRM 70351]MEE1928594.1 hypothetical protein [Streptomyces sp. TRM 70351]
MPRIALYATLVCVLATAAAVVSFVHGSLLGVVWVLMLGVASNIAWFHWRKARVEKAGSEASAPASASDASALTER